MANKRKKNSHKNKIHFLKDIDMFGVPIKLHMHRHDPETDEISNTDVMGSYIGGFTTILVYILCVIYLTSLITQMIHGDNDILNQMVFTSRGAQAIEMRETKFMPHIEIVQGSWEHPLEKFDIWNGNPSDESISSDKLKNYVEVMIHTQIRQDTGSG